MYCVTIVLLLAAIANAQQLPSGGNIWAVLVAGSNTWDNYRHQSDVCHAYHVLHDHGVPDEQIIVFMYDDIANNSKNPDPGVIINHYEGPNVYEGVHKDYTKFEVTPENFINVLLGNETIMSHIGSGKVLKSGPNDHVFINFVDHGAFNLIAFPFSEMHSSDLIRTLIKMHEANMYGKLTFYMEACESGSMFLALPDDINVYVTTAADATESSYACYYDPKLETYLGDVYSVNWMEDSDAKNLTTESLEQQYEIVRDLTASSSHVMQYGDLSISELVVGEFLGLGTSVSASRKLPKVPVDAVRADDVSLEILKRKLEAASTKEAALGIQHQITHLLKNRAELKKTLKDIVKRTVNDDTTVGAIFNTRLEFHAVSQTCYETVVKHFSKTCFPLSQNTYALRHLPVFANMCEMKISPTKIIVAMNAVCTRPVIGIQ